MKKNFRIVAFGSPEFEELFLDEALPYEGTSTPVGEILNQLGAAPHNCRTAVFEYAYVDKDYQDEFAAFYGKTFKRYPHRCTRIHFFGCDIPGRTRMRFGKYAQSYLGFMVLRPTDLQRIGRTILAPPITNHHSQYIHCLAKYEAHILGEKLVVSSMPFIQQDTQVGACAQAALWMLARYMSRRFGFREYLPGEINGLAKANQAWGRPFPAEDGLYASQMLDALQGMSLSAVMYAQNNVDNCAHHVANAFPVPEFDPNNEKDKAAAMEALRRQRNVKLADIAYRYIESGLPVILCTDDHAMVAIGHTYDHSIHEAKIAVQRIPAFYVHNDNTGPYQILPLFPSGDNGRSFLDVGTIIAVMPREVTLRGEQAEQMALNFIIRLLKEKPGARSSDTMREILVSMRPEFDAWFKQAEFRTYLMRSVELQQDLRKDLKSRTIDRAVADKLLVLDYPKYVWVTEISTHSLLDHANAVERKCIGRVIVDSTAPARTTGVIAVHFADMFVIQERDSEDAQKYVLLNSTPFRHKILDP